MKGFYVYLVKVTLIFISVLSIDGGKALTLACKNIPVTIIQKDNSDLEIPDQFNLNAVSDNDKFTESEFQNSFGNSLVFVAVSCFADIKTRDFKQSVWQPPKSC